MPFPTALGSVRRLSGALLTCSSSHHMLTPPLATLSARMKLSRRGLMRRVQALASLAIMLLTPVAGVTVRNSWEAHHDP